MLHPVCYIVKPELLHHVAFPDTNNGIALQVNANDKDDLITCFRVASTFDSARRFCLSAQISDAIDADKANDLIAFFFFPNYCNEGGIPEIILHYEVLKKLQATENVLLQAAKAQGFISVSIRCLPKDKAETIYSSNEISAIRKAYRTILNNSDAATNTLFIKIEQLTAITDIESLLVEEENMFRQQNQQIYLEKEKNKALRAQLQQAEQMIAAAAAEISNQAAHMEILRSQSQARHLQNYYTDEYEVLPVWYKRFGHLLKAVMGKRSFRSLFSENEKKYKA